VGHFNKCKKKKWKKKTEEEEESLSSGGRQRGDCCQLNPLAEELVWLLSLQCQNWPLGAV